MKKNPLTQGILESSSRLLKEKGIDTSRLDAELLLAHTLGLDRAELLMNPSRALSHREAETFQELLQRRANREPAAYILGKKEFWSLDFKVDQRVLIPRPETELLVQCVLDEVGEKARYGLDLGTGSGIIPVVLVKELNRLTMTAVDYSGDTLNLARENSRAHKTEDRIEFIQGDLFEPLGSEKKNSFDFIVSNPPYIPTQEMETLQPEVKDYEPISALDGGGDGLKFIREIIERSPQYLKSGGFLCLETGEGQSEEITELILKNTLYEKPLVLKDYSGKDRVVLTRQKKSRD